MAEEDRWRSQLGDGSRARLVGRCAAREAAGHACSLGGNLRGHDVLAGALHDLQPAGDVARRAKREA
jgi:hypothetical protein